ncbi:LAETG motif-containing sortase-dependent surface protein [Kitasatospora aureofaciens]|uniref:LAETG motif-containing sortase-dependent surface protein n=1 Tax=Kitasatospora aureofaciens TaxID=1894 RepID=UPI00068D5F33|nr:LAETG motif-containing sortase-dependent surface protein [Kitasatospora aureofaciens]
MRPSRLLASAALVALTFGATAGAATAGAVGVPATPSATAAPSTPTGGPTTVPPHVPTPPMPSPGGPCPGGYHLENLKATGSGLSGVTLTRGGAAQEATVTFENDAPVDFKKFSTHFFVTNIGEEGAPNQPVWGKDAFTVQVKLPSADWKPVAQDAIENNMSYIRADLGTFKLAKGEKLTLQVRLAATGKAVSTDYFAQLDGASESFLSKDVPGVRQGPEGSCSGFSGNYRIAAPFKVVDGTPVTTGTPSPSAPATTTAAPAPAPAATASASASAGPELAHTGASSNTLPIALGGAAVLAAGAGTLFVLRRRKAGAHG